MVGADLGRDGSCQGIADDVTLRDDSSNLEVGDLEAAIIPKSSISKVEWLPVVQVSLATVRLATKREEVKDDGIDAGLAWPGERFPTAGMSHHLPGNSESMENIPESTGDLDPLRYDCYYDLDSLQNVDLEYGASGVLSQSLESTKCSSASNEGTRTPSPFSSEASAQSDGIYLAGDDEAVLKVQGREVSGLSDAANAAQDEEAVLEVRVREASPQSDGTYPAVDEEAVPEVQVGSAQIAGVGRDIHVLPSAAMEAPSYRRTAFATPWSSLLGGLNTFNMIEPNAGCVVAGSGLVACAVWWYSSIIFGAPGM